MNKIDRKDQILNISFRLFLEKGYDQTSTNDIVQAVGIARGTLYHHFKSKEEILDAVIDKQTQRYLAKAKVIAFDTSIPVLSRLLLVIQAMNVQEDSQEFFDYIHQTQNALMHEKTQRIILTQVPAIYYQIILDGIKEGIFQTDYPYQTCEWIVAYANSYLDQKPGDSPYTPNQEVIKSFIYLLQRLLNCPDQDFSYLFTER